MSDAGEDSEATIPLDVAMSGAGEDSDSEATIPLEEQPGSQQYDEDSEATVPLEEQPGSQQDDNDDSMYDVSHNEDDAVAVNPNPIELRRQQRQLHKDIQLASNGCTAKELRKFRDTNNELFGHIKRMYAFKKMKSGDATGAREAVLDGKNLHLITDRYGVNAQSLNSVPRYDAYRLAEQLEKKGSMRTSSSSSRRFNWRGFGIQVGLCFNALPDHCSFLYGPLDADYVPKERKKPERRKKQQTQEELSDAEEEQPDTMNQTGKNKLDGNELSAVARHMKVISKTLHQRAEEEHDLAIEKADEYESQLSQEIDDHTDVRRKKKAFIKKNSQVCAVNCLFNPKSFTQTVENVFHCSFLVKETKAGIRNRTVKEAEEFGGMPGPVIVPTTDEGDKIPPKQAIVALTMKDWRDMCKAYNVEKSDVPHRQEGKVSKFDAKRAARETVAAGTTPRHDEFPHPEVTQTDDIEPSGDNDGESNDDDYIPIDQRKRPPEERFAAAADAHQKEKENNGDEEVRNQRLQDEGDGRFDGVDDELARAISQSQHEPSSDIPNNRKRDSIDNNRNSTPQKKSRSRARTSKKSCLEILEKVPP